MATDIDAAIKIASELSTVQANIERANGEAAYQNKRTTTDLMNIRFGVREQKAFWRPIREAAQDFSGNLSNGASQAITAVAYILPWLFVVVPGSLAADAEHDLLSHLLTVAQLPTVRRLRCFRRAERHPSGRGFADLPRSAEEDTRSLLLGINPRSARRATDGRSRLGKRGLGGPVSD
jgi:hypothetical protein